MASEKPTGRQGSLEEDFGPQLPSFRLVLQNHGYNGCSVPSLSIDSGTYSVEPCHLLESSEGDLMHGLCFDPIICIFCQSSYLCLYIALDFTSENRTLCDCADTNGFSEEELLHITFEACDTTGKGTVSSLNSIIDADLHILHTTVQKFGVF